LPDADFSLLAQEYSEDPDSKFNGGDLGWFSKEMMILSEFQKAIFEDLIVDQITSELVATDIGYHIIKKQMRKLIKKQERSRK